MVGNGERPIPRCPVCRKPLQEHVVRLFDGKHAVVFTDDCYNLWLVGDGGDGAERVDVRLVQPANGRVALA